MHPLVVAFEHQHVVGIGFVDFAGDLFLAAHGVHRDDAAGEFEHPEQFGHGGDFVALVSHLPLAQHQLVASGPCSLVRLTRGSARFWKCVIKLSLGCVCIRTHLYILFTSTRPNCHIQKIYF